MLTPAQKSAVAATTRITQIIIVALCAGVVTYMGVAVGVREPDATSTLPLVVPLVFAAGAIVGSAIIGAVVSTQSRRQLVQEASTGSAADDLKDAGRLLQSLQVQKIIRGALLEGAAFMNIVAYHTGGPELLIAVAGVLALGMVLLFPLRRVVEEWLDRELRTIRELRGLTR